MDGDFPFQTLDMVILAILVWSAMLGFVRGIVREVAAILALLVAVVATVILFPHARDLVAGYIDMPVVTNLVAGGGSFLVLYLVSRMLFSMFRAKAEAAQLNGLDRGLGFVFGLARAGLLLTLVFMGVNHAVPEESQPEWFQEFQSRPLLEKGTQALEEAFPEEVREKLAGDVKALQKLAEKPGTGEEADPSPESEEDTPPESSEGNSGDIPL
ncbi:MAG: CvpA family protein [Pseudomonadota bacterium]|nr:CvpA family protein [Pseudomonadota bacterium]